MDTNTSLILIVVAAAVVGCLIGMAFGQPNFISLEEGERVSLERGYERDLERAERGWEREMDDCQDEKSDIVDRMSKINYQCLEDKKELNEGWQGLFQDLNGMVEEGAFILRDMNKVFYDLNC